MKKLGLILLSLALLLVAVPYVNAQTGTIRIDPALPVMVGTEEDFTVYVQPGGDPTAEPNILLVVTLDCYNGMGGVTVTWTGGSLTKAKADFQEATDGYVPPSGTSEGGRYTVASLMDHLSYGLATPYTGPVYWAMGPFVSDPLTTTPQSFHVILTSSSPRMLVYALGKFGNPVTEFNNKVPPTIPGFMVPELGTILLATASFSALALYALKRRKLA